MPPVVCTRCQRANPTGAQYCYYDGAAIGGAPGKAGASPANKLAQEFAFPSGKRAKTYDEFAACCQDEWAAARDLLKGGKFQQYFASCGRLDLARVTQDAMKLPDANLGLANLLSSLPTASPLQGPKLDLNPRRLAIGKIMPGDTRNIQMKVLNQGKGHLQGTLTVTEGQEWMHVGGGSNGQVAIDTTKNQEVPLVAQTKGLTAGQTYGAKLTVVTNGGVIEVPVRMDIGVHLFSKDPFKGAKAPRELAEKMRAQPKAAGPILESGEVARWFAANGWTYPIRGTPAKGVAGVQQFFEALGLSKPPAMQLSQQEVRLSCVPPEAPRAQIALRTPAKKWVYGNVTSDVPWLVVTTPTIAGAQSANIGFEIDPRALPRGKVALGQLQVVANGGQKMAATVRVDIQRPNDSMLRRMVQTVCAVALALLLTRMLIAPVADIFARGSAASFAATRSASAPPEAGSPSMSMGGWLQLPWFGLLSGGAVTFPPDYFGQGRSETPSEFRDYFISSFIRTFVLWTFWIGALLGVWIMKRHTGNWSDAPWGFVCGATLGAAVSATLACMMLVGDMLPHRFMEILFGGKGGLIYVLIWMLVAVGFWTIIGTLLGLVLALLGPLARPVVTPIQEGLVRLFQLCRLRRVAAFFAPA